MRRVSKGWYLAIVPESWERLGPERIAPEPVSISGYKAHYFDLSEGGDIRFRVDGQERLHDVQLVGERIEDAASRLGPLFRDPPWLKASPGVWNAIEKIVIWEEGPGKGRWKDSFSPRRDHELQSLPESLARRYGERN